MNPVLAKVLKKTFATSATVVGALFVVPRCPEVFHGSWGGNWK